VIDGIGAVRAVELKAVAILQQIPPDVQVDGSQSWRGTTFWGSRRQKCITFAKACETNTILRSKSVLRSMFEERFVEEGGPRYPLSVVVLGPFRRRRVRVSIVRG
jgi:hypothetical protein